MGETDGDETTTPPSVILRRLADGSHVVAAARRTRTTLSNSRLAGVVDGLVRTTRNSYLYRWLTKEPEPEVIVIDLRETYTVGPFIKLLDALIDRLEPYWDESRLKQTFVALDRTMRRAAETRLGRFLASLLAPPEPPERDDEPAQKAADGEASTERNDQGDR